MPDAGPVRVPGPAAARPARTGPPRRVQHVVAQRLQRGSVGNDHVHVAACCLQPRHFGAQVAADGVAVAVAQRREHHHVAGPDGQVGVVHRPDAAVHVVASLDGHWRPGAGHSAAGRHRIGEVHAAGPVEQAVLAGFGIDRDHASHRAGQPVPGRRAATMARRSSSVAVRLRNANARCGAARPAGRRPSCPAACGWRHRPRPANRRARFPGVGRR